jgi:hypothetical protein
MCLAAPEIYSDLDGAMKRFNLLCFEAPRADIGEAPRYSVQTRSLRFRLYFTKRIKLWVRSNPKMESSTNITVSLSKFLRLSRSER